MSVKSEHCDGAAADAAADSDMLILVDQADNEVGHMSKTSCHDGWGTLHRAFSILIFNERGELLLQPPAALDEEISAHGAGKFTPWFLIEWSRIRRDHRAAVGALIA